MLFEWDEGKRVSNIEKHGFDFADVDLVFASPHVVGPASSAVGETRWLLVGVIADVFVTVIHTKRGAATRVISMRSARHAERKRYQEIFGC